MDSVVGRLKFPLWLSLYLEAGWGGLGWVVKGLGRSNPAPGEARGGGISGPGTVLVERSLLPQGWGARGWVCLILDPPLCSPQRLHSLPRSCDAGPTVGAHHRPPSEPGDIFRIVEPVSGGQGRLPTSLPASLPHPARPPQSPAPW